MGIIARVGATAFARGSAGLHVTDDVEDVSSTLHLVQRNIQVKRGKVSEMAPANVALTRDVTSCEQLFSDAEKFEDEWAATASQVSLMQTSFTAINHKSAGRHVPEVVGLSISIEDIEEAERCIFQAERRVQEFKRPLGMVRRVHERSEAHQLFTIVPS